MRIHPFVRAAAIRNAVWYLNDRAGFESQLHRELDAHETASETISKEPSARLNGGTDQDFTHIIEAHPAITFWDYTKIRSRMNAYLNGELPDNYFLTFSRHEKHKDSLLAGYLRRGGNVAVVFDVLYNPQHKKIGKLPKTITLDGYSAKVVDGDLHDMRMPHIDGQGVVVGLRLKGTLAAKAEARSTGFAI